MRFLSAPWNPRWMLPLLGAFILSGCGRQDRDAMPPAPVPVETAIVEQRDMPVELRVIGAVEPIASVQLKAKVQGEITKVLFADGAYVAAGQALFEIDPRPFEVALRRAEADLTQARNEAQNAQAQADRYTKLSTQGVASKEQFAQYLTAASSKKSILAARQADADQAKLALDWATVRSPITGRAGAALLKAGNIVQANTDVLCVINQTQPIYVSFSLPESRLAAIREWMDKSAVEVSARDPDRNEPLGSGTLDFLDNTVDRQSGMVAMKATFPNTDESLWPGQFVDVAVKLTEERGVLVVPSTAVMESQSGTKVFVVKDGVAVLQKVKVARMAGDLSIIGSGLSAGQTVISSGQLRVTNGAKVTAASASH